MGIEKSQGHSGISSGEAETSIACLSCKDGVVWIQVKDDSIVSVEDMQELLKACVKLSGSRKYYSIVDVRVNAGANHGVTDYYAKNEYNQYRYADAFIINTLAMRLLVNFYMTFNQPSVPAKTFSDPEQARQWIEELKQRST